MLDQILWNNRFIKINKVSLYFRNWHQAIIFKLSCLVDFSMISQEHFILSAIFYGLLSAISSDWKSYLKLELQAATANVPAVSKLACKTIYSTLIKHRNSSPPTAEKRLKECHFDTDEHHKIYSLPFLMTKEIKLSCFNTRSFIISSTQRACCIKCKKLKVLIVPFA